MSKRKFVHDYLRERLLAKAGVHPPVKKLPPLDELKKTEWSDEFEELCRNRLVMGAFRYGTMKENQKAKFNYVESIESRLKKYKETKNKEYLVDIANMCMLCFVRDDGVFEAIDDGEHAVRIT